MKREEAMAALGKMRRMLRDELGAEMELDPDSHMSEARDGGKSLSIGAAGFRLAMEGKAGDVDDIAFAGACVRFFHEKRHLEQMAALASRDPGDIPEGVLDAIRAGTHHPSEGDAYYSDPAELDAELHGVRGAWSFMVEAFPDSPVESWIFEAKCSDCAFVDMLYEDVDSLDDLEQLYAEVPRTAAEAEANLGAWRGAMTERQAAKENSGPDRDITD